MTLSWTAEQFTRLAGLTALTATVPTFLHKTGLALAGECESQAAAGPERQPRPGHRPIGRRQRRPQHAGPLRRRRLLQDASAPRHRRQEGAAAGRPRRPAPRDDRAAQALQGRRSGGRAERRLSQSQPLALPLDGHLGDRLAVEPDVEDGLDGPLFRRTSARACPARCSACAWASRQP